MGRSRVDDVTSLAEPGYWTHSGLRNALVAQRLRQPSRWCILSSAAECAVVRREFKPIGRGVQLVATADTPFELVKKVWFVLRVEGFRDVQFVARDADGNVGHVTPRLTWVDR